MGSGLQEFFPVEYVVKTPFGMSAPWERREMIIYVISQVSNLSNESCLAPRDPLCLDVLLGLWKGRKNTSREPERP